MVKQNKLKGIMRQNDYSQRDLAKYLGIVTSTLNFKLNGKAEFTKTEIDKILKLFNMPYEEIFL